MTLPIVFKEKSHVVHYCYVPIIVKSDSIITTEYYSVFCSVYHSQVKIKKLLLSGARL